MKCPNCNITCNSFMQNTTEIHFCGRCGFKQQPSRDDREKSIDKMYAIVVEKEGAENLLMVRQDNFQLPAVAPHISLLEDLKGLYYSTGLAKIGLKAKVIQFDRIKILEILE